MLASLWKTLKHQRKLCPGLTCEIDFYFRYNEQTHCPAAICLLSAERHWKKNLICVNPQILGESKQDSLTAGKGSGEPLGVDRFFSVSQLKEINGYFPHILAKIQGKYNKMPAALGRNPYHLFLKTWDCRNSAKWPGNTGLWPEAFEESILH